MLGYAFRLRSLETAIDEIFHDQYQDGKAAQFWQDFIGDHSLRTDNYKHFLTTLLREKKCHNILDVACGTGVDSVLLLEAGFNVTSVDASDKMLKHALKTRWNRRLESRFHNWVIEEANWQTLPQDLESLGILQPATICKDQNTTNTSNGCTGFESCEEGLEKVKGFDALVCLGNSFSHLFDFVGDQREQKKAISNFVKVLKPGGILIIDHRNYDYILDTGKAPTNNIYYNGNGIQQIDTTLIWKNGVPCLITLDYHVSASSRSGDKTGVAPQSTRFRLSGYPHKLDSFTGMLIDAVGSNAKHAVFGDFLPLGAIKDPGFYIHVVEK